VKVNDKQTVSWTQPARTGNGRNAEGPGPNRLVPHRRGPAAPSALQAHESEQHGLLQEHPHQAVGTESRATTNVHDAQARERRAGSEYSLASNTILIASRVVRSSFPNACRRAPNASSTFQRVSMPSRN